MADSGPCLKLLLKPFNAPGVYVLLEVLMLGPCRHWPLWRAVRQMTKGIAGTRRHGTISMYAGKGCRCDPCRAAMSEYWKSKTSDPVVRQRLRQLQAQPSRVTKKAAYARAQSYGATPEYIDW